MYYKVKIKPRAEFKPAVILGLEGEFENVVINDESEQVYLFEAFCDRTGIKCVTRYAIPMTVIESMEIIPIYEDNGEKIPSC